MFLTVTITLQTRIHQFCALTGLMAAEAFRRFNEMNEGLSPKLHTKLTSSFFFVILDFLLQPSLFLSLLTVLDISKMASVAFCFAALESTQINKQFKFNKYT